MKITPGNVTHWMLGPCNAGVPPKVGECTCLLGGRSESCIRLDPGPLVCTAAGSSGCETSGDMDEAVSSDVEDESLSVKVGSDVEDDIDASGPILTGSETTRRDNTGLALPSLDRLLSPESTLSGCFLL